MPIVLYTNRDFEVGSVIDTREFCDLNARVLEAASSEEQEVEAMLEEVRAEHYPQAPDRLCSVLGVPIPRLTGLVRRLDLPWATTAIDTPEPPGTGLHCYHIAGAGDVRRLSADEGYVERLVHGWSRLRRDYDRWRLADDYWSGKVLSGYSVLLEGKVRIVDECREPRFEKRKQGR